MKKTFSKILLVIMLMNLLTVNIYADEINLLQGHLDTDGTGGSIQYIKEIPSNPTLHHLFRIERETEHNVLDGDGKCICFHNQLPDSDQCIASAVSNAKIPVDDSCRYRFNFDIITTEATKEKLANKIGCRFLNIGINDEVLDSEDYLLSLSEIFSYNEFDHLVWKKAYIDFDVPAGFNALQLIVRVYPKNKVRLDDMILNYKYGILNETVVIDDVYWVTLPTLGFFGKVGIDIETQTNIDYFEIYCNDEKFGEVDNDLNKNIVTFEKNIIHCDDDYEFKVRGINGDGDITDFSETVYLINVNSEAIFPLLVGNTLVSKYFNGSNMSNLANSKLVAGAASLLVGMGVVFDDVQSLTSHALDFLSSLSVTNLDIFKRTIDESSEKSISVDNVIRESANQYLDKAELSSQSDEALPSSGTLPDVISPGWNIGDGITLPDSRLAPPVSVPIPNSLNDIVSRDIVLNPDIPVSDDVSDIDRHVYPTDNPYLPDDTTADGTIIGLIKSILNWIKALPAAIAHEISKLIVPTLSLSDVFGTVKLELGDRLLVAVPNDFLAALQDKEPPIWYLGEHVLIDWADYDSLIDKIKSWCSGIMIVLTTIWCIKMWMPRTTID